MFNFFNASRQDRIWTFEGGITPPEMKLQSSGVPLRRPPLPECFIIPLKQHLGPEGELCVAAGEKVLRGQPLTRGQGLTLPVHAPTSGAIEAIRPHMTAHPSALAELCLILRADGEDRAYPHSPLTDFHHHDGKTLLDLIHQAGIAGLGGAGFPTAAKLAGGEKSIDTLIINAAECEPYITADDRLMQERAHEIVTGITILQHIVAPKLTIIGIEDNKPAAAAALSLALARRPDIVLRVIPTQYPSGGAKQLTKILTGREIPSGLHSAAIGVLMLNVGTVFAIKQAVIDGEPLTERVVTLTGDNLRNPGNVWARIGTPVEHLLSYGGLTPEPDQQVIMGGPLMGFALPSTNVPIVKISNCIIAPSAKEMNHPLPEQACIRCSQCADACPAALLPQQLYWYSRGQEHDKARQYHLFDCIECGACAYVCPSNIPLVHYYRREKAEIRNLDREKENAGRAKARYEAKIARREREKAALLLRHQQAAVKLNERTLLHNAFHNDSLAAAHSSEHPPLLYDTLAQAVQGPNQTITSDSVTHESTDHRPTAASPAVVPTPARHAVIENSPPTEVMDERQAAVAAAIARVKARKAAAHPKQED